jgi:hypothetical protein
MVCAFRKTMVKFTCGLGSCNSDAEKMVTIAQRTAIAMDGQELAVAGLQKGRINADWLSLSGTFSSTTLTGSWVSC